jgi:hypothetical protein
MTDPKPSDYALKIKSLTGKSVMTAPTIRARDFSPEAVAQRREGVRGTVVRHSDAHGLCFLVKYDDGGGEGWFDPDELFVSMQSTLDVMEYLAAMGDR